MSIAYLYSCLYPLKVQAHYPRHTLQLAELYVQDNKLVGFCCLLDFSEREKV